MRMILNTLIIGLVLLSSAGCNIMGLGGYVASGSMKSPPEYKLENRRTLVLVENFENPDLYAVQGERIGRTIGGELTDNKVASFVEPAKVDDLKTSNAADFRKMDIPAVGRAVGAKQVIYVNLVKFSTDSPIGDQRFVGRAEARVKVIDAETGHTLWPLDSSSGRVVQLQTKYDPDVDDTKAAVMQDQVCQNLAVKIANLFHETPYDEAPTSADH